MWHCVESQEERFGAQIPVLKALKMLEPTVAPCNAFITENCQACSSFFGMDTDTLVSSMRTLLNYESSVLLERPSLCEDKYREDV